MTDINTIKTQIENLSYEEKIKLSKWLHESIQAGMAKHTIEAAKKLDEKTDSFLSKAKSFLKIKI
jgi:hypothetical protein